MTVHWKTTTREKNKQTGAIVINPKIFLQLTMKSPCEYWIGNYRIETNYGIGWEMKTKRIIALPLSESPSPKTFTSVLDLNVFSSYLCTTVSSLVRVFGCRARVMREESGGFRVPMQQVDSLITILNLLCLHSRVDTKEEVTNEPGLEAVFCFIECCCCGRGWLANNDRL